MKLSKKTQASFKNKCILLQEFCKFRLMEKKQIKANLISDKPEIILPTLEYIKEHGSVDLIPHIIRFIAHPDFDSRVEKVALYILEHVKSQQAVEQIIDAVKDLRGQDKLQKVLSACWKNGLDYSAYIEELIDIAINADYMSTFEVITIIESQNNQIPEEEQAIYLEQLKVNRNLFRGEKEILFAELEKVITGTK